MWSYCIFNSFLPFLFALAFDKHRYTQYTQLVTLPCAYRFTRLSLQCVKYNVCQNQYRWSIGAKNSRQDWLCKRGKQLWCLWIVRRDWKVNYDQTEWWCPLVTTWRLHDSDVFIHSRSNYSPLWRKIFYLNGQIDFPRDGCENVSFHQVSNGHLF